MIGFMLQLLYQRGRSVSP